MRLVHTYVVKIGLRGKKLSPPMTVTLDHDYEAPLAANPPISPFFFLRGNDMPRILDAFQKSFPIRSLLLRTTMNRRTKKARSVDEQNEIFVRDVVIEMKAGS